MKRRRTPRPARCPTLVAMFIAPEVETAELLAVAAFRQGWATTAHFNLLADVRDLLAMAVADRQERGHPEPAAAGILNLAEIALLNIKDRYLDKRKMGGTADELAALDALVSFSADWWKRQSGDLFATANDALDRARQMQREAA